MSVSAVLERPGTLTAEPGGGFCPNTMIWTAAPTTRMRHYTDTSDNPAWVLTTTADGATATDRFVESIGGDLGATIHADGAVELAISNIHDDVATTVTIPADQTDTTAATGIGGWADYTEYGTPTSDGDTSPGADPEVSSTISPAVATVLGYGWLGAKQRSTTPESAGLTLMGDRLYNPVTGNFTSRDPQFGGNTTTYTYPQDPINQTDLDGHRRFWKRASFWRKVGKAALWGSMFIPGLGAAGLGARGGLTVYRGYKAYRAGRAAVQTAGKLYRVNERRRSFGQTRKYWQQSSGWRRRVIRFNIHENRRAANHRHVSFSWHTRSRTRHWSWPKGS
ncbi:RHS repeat-associated core domain-containing protein [Actinomycetota bacterium]